MKTSIKYLAVLFSIVALAGCKSCPCKKAAEVVPVAPMVTEPVPAAPVVAAPEAPAETEEAQAPKAVRQYIK